jgi:hypothetical protein
VADFVVTVEGLSDFMADLKRAPRRIQQDIRGAMRSIAQQVNSRAAGYAPNKSGALASNTTIRVGVNRVTITWNEPYAGVQEFATTYTRIRNGASQQVTLVNVYQPPPRFAYRALNELAPTLGDQFLTAVAKAAAAGGWFDVESVA